MSTRQVLCNKYFRLSAIIMMFLFFIQMIWFKASYVFLPFFQDLHIVSVGNFSAGWDFVVFKLFCFGRSATDVS